MAPDYKTYLATEIISEQRSVSYRQLSRALTVHVNAAKTMLFDFYQRENNKKRGSLYATYLLSGTKKVSRLSEQSSNGTNGGISMPSSPPPIPSSMPGPSQDTEMLEDRDRVRVKTIILCREELLDKVKSEFEHISAIHVYSLSPCRLPDLNSIADTGRSVFVNYHSKNDPLVHNKDYGIIVNLHVRRRKGKRPDNIEAPPTRIVSTISEKAKDASKPELKKEDTITSSRPSSRDSTSTQESKNKPTTKRESSSLFKAFAKHSSKPKLERKDTDTSAMNSDADAKMSGVDVEEEESEDEALFLDTNTRKSKKRSSDVQKEKEERQAKLRKMMEDDGEEVEVPRVEEVADLNAEPPAAKAGEDGDAEDVTWSDSDAEGKKTKQEPKRRRGKRKVVKKRTMKDEDGFLVTREEEAWESFSEEEPPERTPIPAAPLGSGARTSIQKGSTAKSSAPGGKKKDIMSFFGKK